MFKISSDGNAAVSLTQSWLPMDDVPWRVQVQVLTKHGKHAKGLIRCEADKLMYVAWAPLPFVPDWLKPLIK